MALNLIQYELGQHCVALSNTKDIASHAIIGIMTLRLHICNILTAVHQFHLQFYSTNKSATSDIARSIDGASVVIAVTWHIILKFALHHLIVRSTSGNVILIFDNYDDNYETRPACT